MVSFFSLSFIFLLRFFCGISLVLFILAVCFLFCILKRGLVDQRGLSATGYDMGFMGLMLEHVNSFGELEWGFAD